MTNTGKHGEQLAADHLRNNGYEIITTNWHCPRGEIDIVARIKDMLVFVEVKTRRGHKTEAAFASITARKRERLIASVYTYLEQHAKSEVDWRIDVIGVALSRQPVIEHVEDALGW
jgi:putative endonuclease